MKPSLGGLKALGVGISARAGGRGATASIFFFYRKCVLSAHNTTTTTTTTYLH